MIEWLFSNPKLFVYLAVVGAITLVCLVVFAGCWLSLLFAEQDAEQEVDVYFVERKEDRQ